MTSHTSLPTTLTRRDFLKKSGRIALTGTAAALSLESMLLSGCTTFDTKKDWSKVPADQFDIKSFDRWYRWNKLYNGVNPNLRRPHSGGNYPTFRDCVFSSIGATPGIDYNVPWGEVMVAAAPGKVIGIYDLTHDLHTGRAGGMVVQVLHDPLYVSNYCHLDKVFVKNGQEVRRGELIGNVTEHNRYAKLVFNEGLGGTLANCIDPDNYGRNHSFMEYWDGSIDLEIRNQTERWRKQTDINNKFKESFVEKKKPELLDLLELRFHNKGYKEKMCIWTIVEQFRYLEELYKVNPGLFPNLSKDQFESMKKEFYANQPIILTLPLVKGGMKRYK